MSKTNSDWNSIYENLYQLTLATFPKFPEIVFEKDEKLNPFENKEGLETKRPQMTPQEFQDYLDKLKNHFYPHQQ